MYPHETDFTTLLGTIFGVKGGNCPTKGLTCRRRINFITQFWVGEKLFGDIFKEETKSTTCTAASLDAQVSFGYRNVVGA